MQPQLSQPAMPPQNEVQRLQDQHLRIQSFQPQRVAQQNVSADPMMDKFMDRFSNDEYLQQQRANVKKLQEQILRQQIHEKKMK